MKAETSKQTICISYASKSYATHLAYKGTTKNAHTQEKWAICAKKDRLIYLIRYSSLIQARLRMSWWIAMTKCNRFFAHIVSVLQYGLHFATVLSGELLKAIVWVFYENNCLFSKAASEGTTKKRTSARELRFFYHFRLFGDQFSLFCILFFLV